MGAISTLANVGLSAATSRSKSKVDTAAIDAEAERDVATVNARDKAERRERSSRLKADLARQRALAASSGTGGTGGSASALTRGLKARVRDEDQLAVTERERTIRDIRARAGTAKRRNLLDTQSSITRQAVGGALGIGRSLLGG